MKPWGKFGMLAGLALVTTALALATTVPARAVGQDKIPAKKTDAGGATKGLRVFFASHSLLWYAPNPLGELAKAAGFVDHKLVGHQQIGGSRTEQHWNMAEGQNQAKKALKTGEVDVFVMSPIGFPDSGIENFVKLGLEHNPNMRFTFQISWGAWDKDNQTFGKAGAVGNVDRNKTPEEVKKIHADNIKAAEAQAEDINKKYGKGGKVLYLVPSAHATIALRTKIYYKDMPGINAQGELFADAISHPAAPLQALNTYLHYAAIYRQSPVGLPTVSFLKNSKKYDQKVDRTLQELAWETIIKYPYSGVTGKPSDKTAVPAQPEKKDSTPVQPEKKDQPPAKKEGGKGGIPGLPGGKGLPGGFPALPGGKGLPGGFPGLPGAGAATPPPVGNVLSPAAQEKLKLSEQQQRQVQELQSIVDLTLRGILTEDQRKQLEDMKKK